MTDKGMTASHIFSTDKGLRPAEPCTISVATTQQLLTLIFEHIFLTILRKKQYRHWIAAVMTESDLLVLECCNQGSIRALENIVGVDVVASGSKANTYRQIKVCVMLACV
jgi:hypothetical protein